MFAPAATDADLRNAVSALEHALHDHERWSEAVNATLVCRTRPDTADLGPDAHRLCAFGRWYHGSGVGTFDGHPGFVRIEGEHEAMHKAATLLLRHCGDGQPIPEADYRRFLEAMRQMRSSIAALKHELEDSLYNLDPLTGTQGRAGMLAKLRDERALVVRGGRRCVVAMLDLDHFKRINDTYGHVVGDKVLASFARHVMDRLRPYDKMFRYGGEEFLICLPEADIATGYEIVERLRSETQKLRLEIGEGREIGITVSAGLAAIGVDDTIEGSIEQADHALYAAKAGGRNRTMIWNSDRLEAVAG